MEPKAKWRLLVDKHIWLAVVGPYELFVNANNGVCDLSWRDDATESSGNTIWTKTQPTPCDVTDLMRLTEAELARRLTGAAETMDGAELVPRSLADVAEEFMTLPDGSKTSDDVFEDGLTPPSTLPRVAFAHELALKKTYDRLSAHPHGKTTIPEKDATVYDLGAMVGLALCFPSVAFTLNLSRRTVRDVNSELFELALDQRDVCAAPNVYKTSLNCLHEAIGGSTAMLQQAWDDHAEDGVFPPRNLTIVEATPAPPPRFKIGDLVRVDFDGNRRVGAVKAVPAGDWPCCSIAVDNTARAYRPEALAPYTLPPINSYADLADVLDELPEGTLIEGNDRREAVWYRRSQRGHEALLPGWVSWTALSGDHRKIPAGATFRAVPPSEVEK